MKFLNAVDNDPNLRPYMARIEEHIALIGKMIMQLAIQVKCIEYSVQDSIEYEKVVIYEPEQQLRVMECGRPAAGSGMSAELPRYCS